LKKENAKVQEEIDYYGKVIQENDDDDEKIIEDEDKLYSSAKLPPLEAKTMDAKNRVDH
jgi:hypothetical protein